MARKPIPAGQQFEMSDRPLPLPQVPSDVPSPDPMPPALDPEILAPLDDVQFESRIRIVSAWRYPGQLFPPAGPPAPEWVDRSWIGWEPWDPARGIEAGPCLHVPSAAGPPVVCRPGDYVALQQIMLEDGTSVDTVQCWHRDEFERLFMPIRPGSRGGVGDRVKSSQGLKPSVPAVSTISA